MVAVFFASGRMGESSSEIIEVCHGFKAYAMIRIDFSDLLRDDIIGMLQIDAFRKSRNHYQGITILITGPRFVGDFVGYYILTALECLCYLFPICNKEIS
jgi:hypothetical protein